MWKLVISVIGAALVVCIAVPATAGAASEYEILLIKCQQKH